MERRNGGGPDDGAAPADAGGKGFAMELVWGPTRPLWAPVPLRTEVQDLQIREARVEVPAVQIEIAGPGDWHRLPLSLPQRWAWVLAVERGMGIEVPLRARWLRTLAAELAGLVSRLRALSRAVRALGFLSLAERLTERARQLRPFLPPAAFWIPGGVRLPHPEWPEGLVGALPGEELLELMDRILRVSFTASRCVGLAPLDPGSSVGGPLARSRGLSQDLRRKGPVRYGAYDLLSDPPPLTQHHGPDVLARLVQLGVEAFAHNHYLTQLLSGLPAGEEAVPLPPEAPEGEGEAIVEGLWRPLRARVRLPALQGSVSQDHQAGFLRALLRNAALEDVPLILATACTGPGGEEE